MYVVDMCIETRFSQDFLETLDHLLERYFPVINRFEINQYNYELYKLYGIRFETY